jgi:hypothetical protein
LYQVWLLLACWFWRRRILKHISVFLLFYYYLPLKKCYPLCLNKLESPFSRLRGAVVRVSDAMIWWSLRRGFESHCGMRVLVFRMRLYKPRSHVTVGVAR